MKTKDVIAALQKADPTGEEEVCVENTDIISIHNEPASYDGPLQVLKFRENERNYFPIGGKIIRIGNKVSIKTLSLQDACYDSYYGGEKFEVEYIGVYDINFYEKQFEKMKADAIRHIIETQKNRKHNRVID